MHYLMKSSAIAAVLLAGGFALQTRTQDPNKSPDGKAEAATEHGELDSSPAQERIVNSLVRAKETGQFLFGYGIAFDKQTEYGSALAVYRSAAEGQDKEAKKAELKKLLSDIFDTDMKARKAQADEIETRLKKLQDQYKAREAAKDAILDLQIEVLEKDAAGLGFPEGDAANLLSRNGEANRKWPARLSSATRTDSERRLPTLKELLQLEGGVVDELKKKGQFVVSGDGKLFAHASTNHPKGPSMVYVQDAATGKMLTTYESPQIVAEIRFQEGGVGVRTQDGKFEVRIPLGHSAANIKPGPSDEMPQISANPQGNANKLDSGDVGGGELDEYSRIRKTYLNAKSLAENAETHIKEQTRIMKGAVGFDEEKFPVEYRNSVESRFRESVTILDTKLKLLTLDVEAAQASLRVAEAELQKGQEVNKTKPGAINEIEIHRLRLEMEKHKIEVMRAATILDLFMSIKESGEPKRDAAKR